MPKAKKQSAYALKGAAYPYSKHLRDWERATKEGNVEAREEAALAHEQQFGYQRRRGRHTRGSGNAQIKLAA